jgi:hypothetical protein
MVGLEPLPAWMSSLDALIACPWDLAAPMQTCQCKKASHLAKWRSSRYYNDIWAFDVAEMRWTTLGRLEGGAAWPSPRSGCQLALHGDVLFVYGGYSKVSERVCGCTPLRCHALPCRQNRAGLSDIVLRPCF